jgi:exopolyphosphatase/guanosine-5'-triphosphate,3'-diphosphate pyrophosphatase
MTERWVRHDPPTSAETKAIADDLERGLSSIAWPAASQGPFDAVVAIAGTATTYAAIDLELADYASAPPHGHRLSVARLDAIVARLASMPLAARQAVVGLEPKRADVIVAGGLTLRAAARRLSTEMLVVSDRGVRWGLALELLESARA